jgi:hypothetical protein
MNIEFSNQLKPPKKVTKVECEENRKDEPIGVIIYVYIIYIYIWRQRIRHTHER